MNNQNKKYESILIETRIFYPGEVYLVDKEISFIKIRFKHLNMVIDDEPENNPSEKYAVTIEGLKGFQPLLKHFRPDQRKEAKLYYSYAVDFFKAMIR